MFTLIMQSNFSGYKFFFFNLIPVKEVVICILWKLLITMIILSLIVTLPDSIWTFNDSWWFRRCKWIIINPHKSWVNKNSNSYNIFRSMLLQQFSPCWDRGQNQPKHKRKYFSENQSNIFWRLCSSTSSSH